MGRYGFQDRNYELEFSGGGPLYALAGDILPEHSRGLQVAFQGNAKGPSPKIEGEIEVRSPTPVPLTTSQASNCALSSLSGHVIVNVDGANVSELKVNGISEDARLNLEFAPDVRFGLEATISSLSPLAKSCALERIARANPKLLEEVQTSIDVVGDFVLRMRISKVLWLSRIWRKQSLLSIKQEVEFRTKDLQSGNSSLRIHNIHSFGKSRRDSMSPSARWKDATQSFLSLTEKFAEGFVFVGSTGEFAEGENHSCERGSSSRFVRTELLRRLRFPLRARAYTSPRQAHIERTTFLVVGEVGSQLNLSITGDWKLASQYAEVPSLQKINGSVAADVHLWASDGAIDRGKVYTKALLCRNIAGFRCDWNRCCARRRSAEREECGASKRERKSA